jgi:hypothetical protein
MGQIKTGAKKMVVSYSDNFEKKKGKKYKLGTNTPPQTCTCQQSFIIPAN